MGATEHLDPLLVLSVVLSAYLLSAPFVNFELKENSQQTIEAIT